MSRKAESGNSIMVLTNNKCDGGEVVGQGTRCFGVDVARSQTHFLVSAEASAECCLLLLVHLNLVLSHQYAIAVGKEDCMRQ